MITTSIRSNGVLAVLSQLLDRMDDMSPALQEIGEDMVQSVKQRFATATGPDGTPWAPNTQTTLDMYLGLFKGSHNKDGGLSKKGTARSAAKRPLTGETRALATTINYQLEGAHAVSIGSPMVYAAMQNFGGTKAEFPNLWGEIPARVFLGFSAADEANIVDIVTTYFFAS